MSDAEDRTIPATPRRRELARRQGAMPTAAQPAWAAAAATAVFLLPVWSRATFPVATEMMRDTLLAAVVDGAAASPRPAPTFPLALLLPTVAVVTAAGAVGLSVRLLLDGGGWSLSRAAPSLVRISPLAGLARIFSVRTAVAGAASGVGLALVAAAAAWSAGPLGASLGSPAAAAEPGRLLEPMQRVLATAAAGSAVLAACQWGLARARFERRIRMTPREFADESRSMQAAPRVRLLQRQAAAASTHSRPVPDESSGGLRSPIAPR